MQMSLHGFCEKGPGILKVGDGHHRDDASDQLGPTVDNSGRVNQGCRGFSHRYTSWVSCPTWDLSDLGLLTHRQHPDGCDLFQRGERVTPGLACLVLFGRVVCLHLVPEWNHTGN